MNVKKLSLVEIVHDRIKAYIVEHRLKPGDKLPSEKSLIETLAVSRSVVREALKSLQLMGIVEIKSGDGIYVGQLSVKSLFEQVAFHWQVGGQKIKELLDTRKILELGAIDLAIAHYDPEKLAAIEKWNQALEDKLLRNERPLQVDLQFHQALFRATGNETYYQLTRVVHEFFNMSHLEKVNTMESFHAALQQHRDIFHWIKQKEPDRAKQSMIEHLQPLYAYLKK